MNPTQEQVESWTVLRGISGSTLHGLNLPGKDDRDEMGVVVEDIQAALGTPEFEQYIYRSATERSGKHDEPSQPGDLDLTLYSLRKFLRLCMQGNPQLVQLLFTTGHGKLRSDAIGEQLQELAPYIVSRQAGLRYLGYLESQRQRLLGERGQKKVNRPELEAQFGYDTKYAMHMLRLGYQGVELLTTGGLKLPMAEPQRSYVFKVRCGEIPLQEVLTTCGELERELDDLVSDGPLQVAPDRKRVEEWMCDTYFNQWKARQPVSKWPKVTL